MTHHQAYTWHAFLRQQVRRGIGAAYFHHKRGAMPALLREAVRLLAAPALFVRDLWHYHSPAMAWIHGVSGLCQTWGRLQGRWSLAARMPEQCWQEAPSPIKLRYLERYAVGQTALDIGTGAGFYARALMRRGYQIIGADLTARPGLGIPVVRARLSALPFAYSFDTVLAFDVLEHEDDEAQALAELRRLTRCRLLLSVPNADHERLLPYNLTYKHHVDKTHQREYHADELQDKLENAGFRVLVLRREGPVSPAVLAEFIRPASIRPPARLLFKALHRLKVLYNPALMADLYIVAEPREKP